MIAAELRKCKGGCHCGAVRFEILLGQTVKVTHCNCSICRQTGFVHLIVPRDRFSLLAGASSLSEYQFNTRTARHLFCKHCGIKSFYVPRSHPDGYSINFNCIELPEDTEVAQTHFDGSNWSENISRLLDDEGGQGA